jgi:sigma-54 specific flagellar transcriptional regulator A
VLQERTIDPVGSLESLPIDVRVIAATHKNVEQLISQGLFREDLYYRLNVMPIEIVALKERKDDIPVLIQHFAENYAAERQLPISFTASSMSALLHYNWPGNVRELANLITRYTALYGGQQVDLDKVPNSMVPQGLRSDRRNATPGIKTVSSLLQRDPVQPFPNPDINGHVAFDCSGIAIDEVHRVIALAQGGDQFPEEGVRLKQHLLGIEKSLISQALEKAEGNVSKTARLLSLQRTTLIEKINKYGLSNLH